MQKTHNKIVGSPIHSKYPWTFDMTPFTSELEIFKTIYREGSISKASDLLSIDQGNLSRALQRLERRMDRKLFNRHRGGVKPTSSAEELYTAITEMDVLWDRFKNGPLADRTIKIIKLGVHPSIASSYLGMVMTYLNNNFPELHIDIQFSTSIEVTRRVERRELDIGIVANPVKSKDLVIKDFAFETIELCGLTDLKPESILLKNPQMLFIKKLSLNNQFRRVIDIADYDVAASICSNDKNFCCLISSTVRSRHPKLKVLIRLKDRIPIKFITYPGNETSGLISQLTKALM